MGFSLAALGDAVVGQLWSCWGTGNQTPAMCAKDFRVGSWHNLTALSQPGCQVVGDPTKIDKAANGCLIRGGSLQQVLGAAWPHGKG
jgi:hypothetical protein